MLIKNKNIKICPTNSLTMTFSAISYLLIFHPWLSNISPFLWAITGVKHTKETTACFRTEKGSKSGTLNQMTKTSEFKTQSIYYITLLSPQTPQPQLQ